jgi:hypothetical protein
MLKIRPEQWEALTAYAARNFIDSACRHFKGVRPDDCDKLGEEGLRERVARGLEKAKGYGITLERDVLGYINLMFLWGDDFDTDPAIDWARPILAWSPCDGSVKANALIGRSNREIELKAVRELKARRRGAAPGPESGAGAGAGAGAGN